MDWKHRGIRGTAVDFLMALMVGLVPVASGLLVMNHLLSKKLEQNAIISSQEAIFAIDRVIDNLHAAALQATPLAGLSCEEALPELDTQARRNPRVHSLMLTRDDHIFCSTVSGALLRPSTFQKEQHLQLSFGSPDLRNAALLEYRLPDTHPGVVAKAYGLELRNELRGFQDGLVLLLEFNGQYIWGSGDSRDAERPSQVEFHQTSISSKYGYRVEAGYPAGFTHQELYQSTIMVAPSLVLIGLLSSAFFFWSMFRNRVRAKQAIK